MSRFRERYPLRERLRPFISGLLEGTPLVEVAIEGLRRGPPDDLRREYETRILQGGSTEQIHAAMLIGLSGEAQDRMAVAFKKRYQITLVEYTKKVESSESGMHGFGLVREREKYIKRTVEQAARLLAAGKVTSECAQEELAWVLAVDGTPEQAREVIAGGKVTCGTAYQMLRFKTGRDSRRYDA